MYPPKTVIVENEKMINKIVIEYGHEAKPSILGLQIVFLAARRDDGDGGDYRARQEL